MSQRARARLLGASGMLGALSMLQAVGAPGSPDLHDPQASVAACFIVHARAVYASAAVSLSGRWTVSRP